MTREEQLVEECIASFEFCGTNITRDYVAISIPGVHAAVCWDDLEKKWQYLETNIDHKYIANKEKLDKILERVK